MADTTPISQRTPELLADDPLAAEALLGHVRALATEIGPRPTGGPEEAQARAYIRSVLAELGITNVEEQRFKTPSSFIQTFALPQRLAFRSNLGSLFGRWGKLAGGLVGLAAAFTLWNNLSGGRQPLWRFDSDAESANLIVRIPPLGERRHTAVLIGHTDSQLYNPFFEDNRKQQIIPGTAFTLAVPAINGAAQIARALGGGKVAQIAYYGSLLMQLAMQSGTLFGHSPKHTYVDGANDNATAVACLLGLGAQLLRTPLEHTEVWLAFTGAEEVMCVGMHALLDRYGPELREAAFIDFEMVGSADIRYITRHSGMTPLNAYRPDADSLRLAEQVAEAHPELGVSGREMVIVEEVGSLRTRGFRGICIAGAGPDGWLENWHVMSDTTENITADGIERAARFALEMLRALDGR